MCGICGEFRAGGARESELRRMTASLSHRGPDGEGVFLRGPVGLANRRLAIIDPAGGDQPIANEDGTIHVVFNGEIYNFARPQPASSKEKGHRFRQPERTPRRSSTPTRSGAMGPWNGSTACSPSRSGTSRGGGS